jgi:CBS-domain-containing membrane protein
VVRFNLLDQKFKQYPLKYVIQCLVASLTIMLTLSFLNLFHQTTMIASLGATTFIVFAMPSAHSAKARGLIGGYLIGILIGVVFDRLFSLLAGSSIIAVTHTWYSVFGALAVGATIFLMVVTNTEHPPAVGVALSLVIQPWEVKTLVFLVSASLLLAAARRILGSWLIDLQ